ncbi:hypothetical protein PHISCL_02636 [Aspergillus sclerotialis]|uniref:Uncharacterized protein n=1 Tax=Aspergillus sclerotialis TaxID=2070753 RepID=A0A3A2ZRU5_9EURO|nr:hypothetical protein PHISCL_02636 [Aspergillus sclerotialis]
MYLVSQVGKTRGWRRRNIARTTASDDSCQPLLSNQPDLSPFLANPGNLATPPMDKSLFLQSPQTPNFMTTVGAADPVSGPYSNFIPHHLPSDERMPPSSIGGIVQMDDSGNNNRFTGPSCIGEGDWIQIRNESVVRSEASYSDLSGDYANIQGWKELYQPSRQSVIACAELVAHLEAQLKDELTLDEVLAINRDAAREISRIILLEGFPISQSCPIILTLAEDLIVTLFEQAIQKTRHIHSTGPKVVFGNFSLGPEEQAELKAQIMRKELRHHVGIIQKLLAVGSAQAKSEEWLRELDERMQTLISVIDGR